MYSENYKTQGQNRKPELQQVNRKTDSPQPQHIHPPRSQPQLQHQPQPQHQPQHKPQQPEQPEQRQQQQQQQQQQPQQPHPKNASVSPDWLRGLVVRVKTQLGEEATGQVYLYDPVASVLVLQTLSKNSPIAVPGLPAPTPLYDFRILKISTLIDVTPVSSSTNVHSNEQSPPMRGPPLEPINLNKIQSKEQAALRDHAKNISRIGVGVSREGQDLYDALSRTLPCRWAQDAIVVMDEVIIHPPYLPNNCKTNNPSGGSLTRVKKVLEGERRRLGLLYTTGPMERSLNL